MAPEEGPDERGAWSGKGAIRPDLCHLPATLTHTPEVSEMSRSTRREFIRNTAALGAVGVAAAKAASAQTRRKRWSPNDRIHVGLIGCGGMG